jgi:hypothetical protein
MTCRLFSKQQDDTAPISKLYVNSPLDHKEASHGLNPQESARNHGYGTSGAVRKSAANRVLEYSYKYL